MRFTSEEYLNIMALAVNKIILEPIGNFVNSVEDIISDIPTKQFMKKKGNIVDEIWSAATINHKKYAYIKELEKINGVASSNIKITGQI